MANDLLYFDDLAVGDRFSSGTCEVSAEDIKRFAGEFDPQPFHLDDAAARKTMFGGLAASGWHTAAITMRLLVEGGVPIAGGLVGAGGEIKWPKPTRPGGWVHPFQPPTLPSSNNFVAMGAFETSFICRRDGPSRSDVKSAIGFSRTTPP